VEPEVDFSDETLCINGNPEGLGRMFRNLIGNAMLHGSGEIRIVQSERSISFMNPLAKGIELDAERLFERFYKGDITRKKGSTGLGLAIVKELAQRMNGEVKAEILDGWLKITIVFDER
jgi:signal transduction histidine kinase